MQERVNKHKPIIKKEVTDSSNLEEQSCFTQNSKFSSNSQNKPFIRKPVSKRQGFASPTYIKNQPIQNAQSNSPSVQSKSKRSVPLDSHSDQDYWQRQQIPQSKLNIAIKRHISNQQNLTLSNTLFNNTQAIKQAYYGNDVCSLTEIGENYKVQTIESDKSQRDLYFSQNMKKTIKQNIALMNINSSTKKTTRTQYFTNNNDEVKSITSRSLKEKEINFIHLKTSANNSVQVYIRSLEQNIRKLQKTTYTLNKKCKWMHEQVEMHLQKENTMTKQNQILTVDIKEKQTKIQSLSKQLEQVKLQLSKIKSHKKQSPIRYKSFKDIQTISSLRQLSTKKDQYLKVDNSKKSNQTADDGYFANTSLSSQKNKKLSFKTYPGVRSPRNRKQDLLKSSSIVGNNDSSLLSHELGQTSILDNKQCLKQQISLQRTQFLCKQLQKEREQLRVELQSFKQQMQKTTQQQTLKLSQNTKHYENKLTILQSQIENHKKQINEIREKYNVLEVDFDRILVAHQQQVETLNFKIKQLQGQLLNNNNTNNTNNTNKTKSLTQSTNQTIKDFQFLNPLQFLLQHPDQSLSTDDQHTQHHYEQQNKSLRKYIQQMLQHYKYIKIENRMLLKLKQDLQKCEKQKKQIKQQRDMFKKKLLDTLKNYKPINNKCKNNKNKNKMAQYEQESEQSQSDDDESQSQSSAMFQLSQSQIIYHPQSEISNH